MINGSAQNNQRYAEVFANEEAFTKAELNEQCEYRIVRMVRMTKSTTKKFLTSLYFD